MCGRRSPSTASGAGKNEIACGRSRLHRIRPRTRHGHGRGRRAHRRRRHERLSAGARHRRRTVGWGEARARGERLGGRRPPGVQPRAGEERRPRRRQVPVDGGRVAAKRRRGGPVVRRGKGAERPGGGRDVRPSGSRAHRFRELGDRRGRCVGGSRRRSTQRNRTVGRRGAKSAAVGESDFPNPDLPSLAHLENSSAAQHVFTRIDGEDQVAFLR